MSESNTVKGWCRGEVHGRPFVFGSSDEAHYDMRPPLLWNHRQASPPFPFPRQPYFSCPSSLTNPSKVWLSGIGRCCRTLCKQVEGLCWVYSEDMFVLKRPKLLKVGKV